MSNTVEHIISLCQGTRNAKIYFKLVKKMYDLMPMYLNQIVAFKVVIL